MRRVFFYDTWAFVALANRSDPAHGVAVELDLELERLGYVALTSDYVLDETLTLLSVAAGARVAIAFLDGFSARVQAGSVQLLQVTAARRERALALFRRLVFVERRLSFTDATSFALMLELAVSDVFTADAHFSRAGRGIRPLLRREGKRLRSLLTS